MRLMDGEASILYIETYYARTPLVERATDLIDIRKTLSECSRSPQVQGLGGDGLRNHSWCDRYILQVLHEHLRARRRLLRDVAPRKAYPGGADLINAIFRTPRVLDSMYPWPVVDRRLRSIVAEYFRGGNPQRCDLRGGWRIHSQYVVIGGSASLPRHS